MKRLGIDDSLPCGQKSIVTVGNFDGVHKGHATLFNEVVKRSVANGACSVAITFEPNTKSVVYPELSPMLITTLDEKEILIESFGLDYLMVIPFDEDFRQLSPQEFVSNILVGKLRATGWVMGEGHSVGKDRRGGKNFLPEVVDKYHINMFTANLCTQDETVISSTKIRKLIVEGRITQAVDILGHPYLICVQRISGTKTGTKLGYPTINFRKPSSQKVIPPAGVYAAELEIRGVRIQGALYYGDCPTFTDRNIHFEFHALSFQGDEPRLDEWCRIWLHKFIRKDEPFGSEEVLRERIAQDIEDIKSFFYRREKTWY